MDRYTRAGDGRRGHYVTMRGRTAVVKCDKMERTFDLDGCGRRWAERNMLITASCWKPLKHDV